MVKARMVRDPEKAWRVVRSLRRLCDRWREGLRPSEFWTPGTWHPGPRFANLYVIVLKPRQGKAGPELARHAARLLELRGGVLLDWAAGFRSSGTVWLLVKPRAADARTLKRTRWGPDEADLAALRALMQEWGRDRARERDREQERKLERERGRTRT
jgi:hypothetical protein